MGSSLPPREARHRFYARKDLPTGWTGPNPQCASRGLRGGTCQIKDATSFFEEIHSGQLGVAAVANLVVLPLSDWILQAACLCESIFLKQMSTNVLT